MVTYDTVFYTQEAVHEGTERMEEISRSIDAVASSSPRGEFL